MFRNFCLGVLAAGIALSAAAQTPKTLLGILPVYDSTAENFSEAFPVNMTFLMYAHLKPTPGVEPVLLSPGGLYDPDSIDFIRQYGKKAHVDAILITKVLHSIPSGSRHRRLNFEARFLDVATGKLSDRAVNDTVEVSTSDLMATFTSAYVSSTYRGFFAPPSEFSKQPLGKAAVKIDEWLEGILQPTLKTIGTVGTGPVAPPQEKSCEINFSVAYTTKHAIAKSYTVIANEKDESSEIHDGHAAFTMHHGPLAFRVQLNDPPYALPTEKQYQISTQLNCASPYHTVVMEIGSSGEALLKWQ